MTDRPDTTGERDATPPDREAPEPERHPGVPPHQPYRPGDVDEVDEAAEQSFPASDPPSWNPGSTG